MATLNQPSNSGQRQLIDAETAASLGGGSESDRNRAATNFTRACRHYARMFGNSLSIEDHEDLVQGVSQRALPMFEDFAAGKGLAIEELNRKILQDIWRTRKQLARASSSKAEELDESSLGSGDPTEALIERDLFTVLVARAEYVLLPALRSLSNRDYNLIVKGYQFDQLGMPLKRAKLPLTEDAQKKAMQRARKNFQKALEARILDLLESERIDRPILEALLRVVRGGLIGLLFETASQFSSKK